MTHKAYQSGVADYAVAVTPSDSTTFTPPLDAVYVGVTGDVAILPPGNTAAETFVGVPAGTTLPVRASKVMATNTTATSIVGLR